MNKQNPQHNAERRVTNSSSTCSEQELSAVAGLWTQMRVIFPGTWKLSDLPAEALQVAAIEWAKSLREFTGAQIVDGLDRMKRDGLKFAPELPQFLSYCRASKPLHQSHYPAIPHGTGIGGYVEHVLAPNAKSKVAQEELEKIRQILRRKGNPLSVDDPDGFDAMVAEHDRHYGIGRNAR